MNTSPALMYAYIGTVVVADEVVEMIPGLKPTELEEVVASSVHTLFRK